MKCQKRMKTVIEKENAKDVEIRKLKEQLHLAKEENNRMKEQLENFLSGENHLSVIKSIRMLQIIRKSLKEIIKRY